MISVNFKDFAAESPYLAANVHCPEISRSHDGKLNWNILQCKLRVEEDNACVHRCNIGRKILGLTKIDPVKQVKKAFTGHRPSTVWGADYHFKRNREITFDSLNGVPKPKVAKKYNVTKTRVNQIVMMFCKNANEAEYSRLCTPKFSVVALSKNKDLFLPNIPRSYPYVKKSYSD